MRHRPVHLRDTSDGERPASPTVGGRDGGIQNGLGHRGEPSVRRVDHDQRRRSHTRRAVAVRGDVLQRARLARPTRADGAVRHRKAHQGLQATRGQLLRHHRRQTDAQRRVLGRGDELSRPRHRRRHGRPVLPGQRRRTAVPGDGSGRRGRRSDACCHRATECCRGRVAHHPGGAVRREVERASSP